MCKVARLSAWWSVAYLLQKNVEGGFGVRGWSPSYSICGMAEYAVSVESPWKAVQSVLCITWVTFSVVYCSLIQTHKRVIYNTQESHI